MKLLECSIKSPSVPEFFYLWRKLKVRERQVKLVWPAKTTCYEAKGDPQSHLVHFIT